MISHRLKKSLQDLISPSVFHVWCVGIENNQFVDTKIDCLQNIFFNRVQHKDK